MKTKQKNTIFIISFIVIAIGLLYFVFIMGEGVSEYTSFSKEDYSCISCHQGMTGLTTAHLQINCTDCHLGNEMASSKQEAHRQLTNFPGNLDNASQTCSTSDCHPGIDHRVEHSIMNTMSGIINVDKYAFGEHQNLDSIFDVYHLGSSMAESHLRQKCASCHLGKLKTELAPISELTRGGGCLACHLNYSSQAENDLNNYLDLDVLPTVHPSVSLKVTDDHCFGCHSRSGRIATNYQGWHETILKKIPAGDPEGYRLLEDHRIFEKKEADIHSDLGLSCIDCHDTWDVMGDGQLHAHKEDVVTAHCTDCHSNKTVKSSGFSALDVASKNMIRSRKMDSSWRFVISPFYKKQLTNVVLNKKEKLFVGKNNKKQFVLSSPSEYCSNPVHQKVSCSTCHTQWAPQCISCHTSFVPDQSGYDLLTKNVTPGKWHEKGSRFFAEFPSLGVVYSKGAESIKTFVPGMIMNLNRFRQDSLVRLFAPTSAHTISAEGKKCKECHNNPVALGYGRGQLVYSPLGEWSFIPRFEKLSDELPMDAWIEFLSNDTIQKATRNNARPFNFEEQKKMLSVGACLTCHNEESSVIQQVLLDYETTLKHVSKSCVLPKIIKP